MRVKVEPENKHWGNNMESEGHFFKFNLKTMDWGGFKCA